MIHPPMQSQPCTGQSETRSRRRSDDSVVFKGASLSGRGWCRWKNSQSNVSSFSRGFSQLPYVNCYLVFHNPHPRRISAPKTRSTPVDLESTDTSYYQLPTSFSLIGRRTDDGVAHAAAALSDVEGRESVSWRTRGDLFAPKNDVKEAPTHIHTHNYPHRYCWTPHLR